MRVPETVRFMNTAHSLQQVKRTHEDLIAKMASQKRINRLSDDPAGIAQIVNHRQLMQSLGQYGRNANQAESFLSVTETALTGANDLLLRAGELAIGQATGTVGPQERLVAAQELRQIIEALLQQANSVHQGRHIFAGSRTEAAPFSLTDRAAAIDAPVAGTGNGFNGAVALNPGSVYTAPENKTLVLAIATPGSLADARYKVSQDGGATWSAVSTTGLDIPVDLGDGVLLNFTAGAQDFALHDTFTVRAKAAGYYHGDDRNLELAVGRGASLSYNITGGAAFAGTVDTFQVLLDLRTALENNDPAGIGQAIDRVREASDQIVLTLAKVGAQRQRVDLALDHVDRLELEITKAISAKEDIDMAELISRFTSSEAALRASYEIAARIGRTSLLDFLR